MYGFGSSESVGGKGREVCGMNTKEYLLVASSCHKLRRAEKIKRTYTGAVFAQSQTADRLGKGLKPVDATRRLVSVHAIL